MDRIAIISDIHGNLPALEAVMEDINDRNVDKIFCLGDIVGKGPSMKETIDLCRSNCDIIVKGNWDDYLCRQLEDTDIKWYQNKIGHDRLSYLSMLPEKVEFYMSGKLFRLFHAHPQSLYKRIFFNSGIDEKLDMFGFLEGDPEIKYKSDADIIGYGDIHNAYLQSFQNKVLFNTGSVGNSLDIPGASYVLLEGEYGCKTENTYSIQFCRVPYDIELSISQAIGTGLPKLEAYINELKTAKYSR